MIVSYLVLLKKYSMKNKNIRNFQFIKSYTAGIVLNGPEVKSIIVNKDANIDNAYCYPAQGELFIDKMQVSRYGYNSDESYVSDRVRKLLLHRKQIDEICMYINKHKGTTLIPVNIYREPTGFIKITIAIVKHIKKWDDRQKIKDKLSKQESKNI